jgi:sugar phosphate isomerase/epimerase
MSSRGIAYCTNVHAGADVAETLRQLELHATRVREIVSPTERLPIGLWLSALAAGELDSPARVAELRERIDRLGLEVVTLNGFPFIDFHGHAIKHAVYEPHWARPERLAYTVRLANILVDLLPPGTRHASISTVPIGWRPTFTNEGCAASVGMAAAQLEATAAHLARIERERGVRLHLDLEPEPGCLLDRSGDAVALFEQCFPRSELARRHIGICHDICHAAVMFEPQRAALAAYRDAGIRVGKVQVSSAIEADGSRESLAMLRRFDEPKYLHQTCIRMDAPGASGASGTHGAEVRFFEDLGAALGMPPRGTARTHFHVPIHLATLGAELAPLVTTQPEILACIDALRALDLLDGEDAPTLEIETYAWTVLPEPLRPASLAEGIAEEIRWLAEALR